MEILENLNWSEPKRVRTRFGEKLLRKTEPTDEFWKLWKSNKDRLKTAGYSISKTATGDWELCHWGDISEEERAEIREAVAASSATDAEIDIPAPEGLRYLPYQRAGISYAKDRTHVLIGDQMGLGKSIQALGIINLIPEIKRILIICPASLKLNWKREAEKWLVADHKPQICGTKEFPDADFVIINYDLLKKFRNELRANEWDLVVADECHYLKNPNALRTKEVFGSEEEENEKIPTKRFVGLTGTAVQNRPKELWTFLRAFEPTGIGKNFFAFAKRYCGAVHNGYGWDFNGSSNEEELGEIIRSKFFIRRLKKDVLKELPAKIRQVIEVHGKVSKKEIELVEKLRGLEAEARLAEAEENEQKYRESVKKIRAEFSARFEEFSKLRHDTALEKVPFVVEHLQSALESGPTLCFAHHHDVIDTIQKEFPDSRTLTGRTPQEERQKIVDDFQAGKFDLLILSIGAGGVGLTLTRASQVVFAELDWVPGNVSQAEDRAHRIGQDNSVLIQHIVLENSLDAYIAHTVVRKQEIIERILDSEHKPDASEIAIVPLREGDLVVEEEEKEFSDEQIAAIDQGLKIISSYCDGAKELDGRGFSKIDVAFGKSLALSGIRTQKQAKYGFNLVRKYQRQLPKELLNQAGVK